MASSLGFSEINSTPTLTKIKNQSHSLTGKKKITSAETEKLFKQLNSSDDDDDGPNLLEPPKISTNEELENDASLIRTNNHASYSNTTIPKIPNTDNCV